MMQQDGQDPGSAAQALNAQLKDFGSTETYYVAILVTLYLEYLLPHM